jgi:hypothetical protein
MSDPFREAAMGQIEGSFGTLRRAVAGLSAEALNWEPAGEETNSIAVLVTHSMYSTRLLLHIAVGDAAPDRDRPAEFRTSVSGPDELLRLVDTLGAECLGLIGGDGPIDWAEMRTRTRSGGESVESPAAAFLMQAVVHLRGHADEASLTRHFWEARG